MLSSYRSVLSRPGALRFSVAGLFGRLPLSMAGLGMLLLVQAESGSYGLGGSVSAAYMVANAIAALPLGRLVDARGQGRVLALGSLVFGSAMVALVVTVEADWPLWSTYAAAAVAGATLPPIDACVRTRWAHVLDRPDEVETAYAFEAVVDESVFIVGPILVTLLATLVDPIAGIAATVVAGVGGSLAFAAQRGTEPPAHPVRPGRRAPGAAALADPGAADGRVCRPGPDVRCRRGHHGRVRGRARQQVRRRAAPGPVGARQPARRRDHGRGDLPSRAHPADPMGSHRARGRPWHHWRWSTRGW